MTENLPILTGKTLSLIALFGLYMRLLDSISIVNSKQGIRIGKLVYAKSLHCDGLELYVGVIDLDYYLGQSSLIHTPS